MKTHKFDIEDAEKYGIEKAILLEHLKFHQESNSSDDNFIFNGKTYATLPPDTAKKMYPYLSHKSIYRWLNELEKDGILKSKKPNSKQGNHTKYYHVIGHHHPISQNENSISQNGNIQKSQNENSTINNHVNTYEYTSPEGGVTNGRVRVTKKTKIVDYLKDVDLSQVEDKNIVLACYIWKDVDALIENNTDTKKSKLLTWADPIRLMVERDGRTYKEIWGLWKRIQADEFERTVVLSTSKLRDRFNNLKIKLHANDKSAAIRRKVDSMFGSRQHTD